MKCHGTPGDRSRLAPGGPSAGGELAHACSRRSRAVSASTDRVQAALSRAGSSSRVAFLEASGRTAAEAAAAIGIELGQIVKSLLFEADREPVLLLVAGDRMVDPAKVAAATGRSRVVMASPERVREATGFAIGGVAPLGHPRPLETHVDESLQRFEVLWAAAGAPDAVFETSLDELLQLTGGTLAAISREP